MLLVDITWIGLLISEVVWRDFRANGVCDAPPWTVL